MNSFEQFSSAVIAITLISIALFADYHPALAEVPDTSTGGGQVLAAAIPYLIPPTLPEKRKKISVPGHETEYCYELRIPELRDPRDGEYCEWTYQQCIDLRTERVTYLTPMVRRCGQWPDDPPSTDECTGQASDPKPELDFFACEDNATFASFNCMQRSTCRYGIGIWECGLLPRGLEREECFRNVESGLTNRISICQAAYRDDIQFCEIKWSTGDFSRVNSCLRTAHRIYTMDLTRCDFTRDRRQQEQCYDDADRAHALRRSACLLEG